MAANRFKVPPVMQALMDDLNVDMVTGGWFMAVSSVAGVVLAIPAAFYPHPRGAQGRRALSPWALPSPARFWAPWRRVPRCCW